MLSTGLRTDGSAVKDARRTKIDRDEFADRARYVCPNGHMNWSPTNSHIWCASCSRAAAHDEEVHPEHYHLFDKKTGEEIPYAGVTLVE